MANQMDKTIEHMEANNCVQGSLERGCLYRGFGA